MALTERTEQDKIECVGPYRSIQIRTATVIEKDGVEINRSFHRHVLHPCTKASGSWADTDISGESAEVQGICNAVWSDAVKKAYQTNVDSVESS